MALSRHCIELEMSGWQAGAQVLLPEKTAHHLSNVLRKKVADQLHLFDGQGREWHATIIEIKKRALQVELIQPVAIMPESPLKTHLGIALFKADRFDFAIQKAVELGVNRITPLITDHVSIKQSDAHLAKRMRHWQGVMIAACEQSRRSIVPQLSPIMPFHDWAAQNDDEATYILHPPHPAQQSDPSKPLLSESTTHAVRFASGPEGGFSDKEVVLAESFGFHRIAMGPRILRAETAPLAFLTLLQFMKGDFGECGRLVNHRD